MLLNPLISEDRTIQNDVEGEHFVLTAQGIINLHDDIPKLQPYAEVRHLSADASREEWEAICRSNYEQATYVVFDRLYTAPGSIRSEEVIHFFDDTELLEPKSIPCAKRTRRGLGLGRVDNLLFLFDVPSHFEDEESLSFI